MKAARFVEGRVYEVIEPQAPLRREPRPDASLETEALKGERVTIYDANGEGWAWGQLAADGYVGWLPDNALTPPGAAPTHKVTALRTLMFPGPSIKLPPLEALPLGARLAIARIEDRMAVTQSGGMCRRSTLRRSTRMKRISSPSRSASSARLICGAARPRSASTARARPGRADRVRRLMSTRQRHAGRGIGNGRVRRSFNA